MKKNIKIIIFALSISFLTAICIYSVITVKGEKTVNVFDNTVRLRVVANSDSKKDQDLKLAVRNDIIAFASDIFKDCVTIEAAKENVRGNLKSLEEIASQSVIINGGNDKVTVYFTKEKAPVRRYSDFTFPSGEYLTLHVDIGKAQGKNWWCVMYPPLCVDVATNDVYTDIETFRKYGFSDSEINELTQEKPLVHFALFDYFKQLFN